MALYSHFLVNDVAPVQHTDSLSKVSTGRKLLHRELFALLLLVLQVVIKIT